MRHHLAGGGADAVSVRAKSFVEESFCLPDECEKSDFFLTRRIEEACDMPEGDDEEVAGIFIHSALRIPLSVSKGCMKCFFIPGYTLKSIYLGAEGNTYGKVDVGQ